MHFVSCRSGGKIAGHENNCVKLLNIARIAAAQSGGSRYVRNKHEKQYMRAGPSSNKVNSRSWTRARSACLRWNVFAIVKARRCHVAAPAMQFFRVLRLWKYCPRCFSWWRSASNGSRPFIWTIATGWWDMNRCSTQTAKRPMWLERISSSDGKEEINEWDGWSWILKYAITRARKNCSIIYFQS